MSNVVVFYPVRASLRRRNILRLSWALLALLAGAQAVQAQSEIVMFGKNLPLATLGAGPVYVEVVDDVTDGCWASPSISRNAVELELRRNNIIVDAASPPTAIHSIVLYGIGYGLPPSNCAVTITLEFRPPIAATLYADQQEIASYIKVAAYDRLSILTGNKFNMSDRIRQQFIIMTEDLIANSAREKQAVRDEIDQSSASAEVKSMWLSTFQQ